MKIGQCVGNEFRHNSFFHWIDCPTWPAVTFHRQTKSAPQYLRVSKPIHYHVVDKLLWWKFLFTNSAYEKIVILETWFAVFKSQIAKISIGCGQGVLILI